MHLFLFATACPESVARSAFSQIITMPLPHLLSGVKSDIYQAGLMSRLEPRHMNEAIGALAACDSSCKCGRWLIAFVNGITQAIESGDLGVARKRYRQSDERRGSMRARPSNKPIVPLSFPIPKRHTSAGHSGFRKRDCASGQASLTQPMSSPQRT